MRTSRAAAATLRLSSRTILTRCSLLSTDIIVPRGGERTGGGRRSSALEDEVPTKPRGARKECGHRQKRLEKHHPLKVSDDAGVTEAKRLQLLLMPLCPGRLPSVAFHLNSWHAERRPNLLQKGSVSARAASEHHWERKKCTGAPLVCVRTATTVV